MKKQLFLFSAAMFFCGAMMLSSCSKDEEIAQINNQEQPAVSNPYVTFSNVVSEVNQNLRQFDFAEVKPLATALNNNTAVVVKGFKSGVSAQNQNDFLSRISDMVRSFFPVYDENNPFTYSGTYTNSKETMRLAWEIMGYFTRHENYFDLTGNNCVNVEILVNDTTTYVVNLNSLAVAMIDRTTHEVENYGLGNIVISKNDELLVSVAVNSSIGYNYSEKKPYYAFSGQISYQTHLLTIVAKNGENDHIDVDIVYQNEENPMIVGQIVIDPYGNILNPNANVSYRISLMQDMAVINGLVSDVKSVAESIPANVTLLTSGGTKAQCDEFARNLNGKHVLGISLAGSEQGSMYLGSELVENTEDTYKPTLILQFAMFDNEPMTINEILDIMGINISDLLNR